MSLIEIQRAASELSAPERGILAAWLLGTLRPHEEEDALEVSHAEALRRKQELVSGSVAPLGEDEFWAAADRGRRTWS